MHCGAQWQQHVIVTWPRDTRQRHNMDHSQPHLRKLKVDWRTGCLDRSTGAAHHLGNCGEVNGRRHARHCLVNQGARAAAPYRPPGGSERIEGAARLYLGHSHPYLLENLTLFWMFVALSDFSLQQARAAEITPALLTTAHTACSCCGGGDLAALRLPLELHLQVPSPTLNLNQIAVDFLRIFGEARLNLQEVGQK